MQAAVRLQQHLYSVSEDLLRSALNRQPNNRQALYYHSQLLAATNRTGDAITAATSAAQDCWKPRCFCAALHTHLADLLHTNNLLEAATTVSKYLSILFNSDDNLIFCVFVSNIFLVMEYNNLFQFYIITFKIVWSFD